MPTLPRLLAPALCLLLAACTSTPTTQQATNEKPTPIPAPGTAVLAATGTGWTPLLTSLDPALWNFQPEYWKIDPDGTLHGISPNTPQHHFLYSNADFTDFELHADFKLTVGNSGICIRIAPTSFDNVPGYQIDMGQGYWGCLWDEKGRGMVVKYPPADADKLLHKNDWNHYYVVARGHHIQAWLNGTKTIDILDTPGRPTGKLGLQLVHAQPTDVQFKNILLHPLPPEPTTTTATK